MRVTLRHMLVPAVTVLATAACSDTTRVPGTSHTTILLSSASSVTAASLVLDDSGPGHPGRIDAAWIDSLMVTVVRVDILPAHRPPGPPDSLIRPDSGEHADSAEGRHGGLGGRSGPPIGPGPRGPIGPGFAPESLPPGTRQRWISLEVVANGRIDLAHLPTEDEGGITLAEGDIASGEYRVRLVVSDATIWLNTPVVSAEGDTLQAGVGYAVIFPSGGVMAEVDLTVPEGGGNVQLVFDENESLARVVVTGDGRVLIAPVMRHRRPPST